MYSAEIIIQDSSQGCRAEEHDIGGNGEEDTFRQRFDTSSLCRDDEGQGTRQNKNEECARWRLGLEWSHGSDTSKADQNGLGAYNLSSRLS